LWLDEELIILIDQFAKDRDLGRNGAVRYLLRSALKIPTSTHDAVWREVRMEQAALMRAATNKILGEIPATPKGRKR
jgi:hypothetical protein